MTQKPVPGRTKRLFAAALAIIGALIIASPVFGDSDQEQEVSRFEPAAYVSDWLTSDRNNDGTVDYAVRVDERGNKLQEAMDFNLDGHMDDFYFYANDVLQRQELDSNFDQQIDIWIYMWRGVYVQKWERDTDFDGRVDLSRDYDELQ